MNKDREKVLERIRKDRAIRKDYGVKGMKWGVRKQSPDAGGGGGKALSVQERYKMASDYTAGLGKRLNEKKKAYNEQVNKWIKDDTKGMSVSQYNHLVLENGGDPSSPFRDETLRKWAENNHKKESQNAKSEIQNLARLKEEYDKKLNDVIDELWSSKKPNRQDYGVKGMK